jgi:hypothetical protein
MVNGILYSPQYNYLAYFCAKSGCCSLRNLFIQLHKNELNEENQKLVNTHNAKIYFTLPTNFNIEKIKKFIVVRNPYLRVVSMYTNKYVGEDSHIKKSMKEKNIKNTFGNSFLKFLNFLKHLKETKMLNKLDGHIYEQTHNFKEKENCTIIKLENFSTDILDFYKNNYSNLTPIVEESLMSVLLDSNKTKMTKEKVENVSNFVYEDRLTIFPFYSCFYNNEAKALVDEIYHDDFLTFNYKKELPF